MKKIQTAINNNIGNQDNKTPNKDGILSSNGAAEMLTPLLDNFSIKFGSLGEYVENLFPLERTPLMLFPCISTFTTLHHFQRLIRILKILLNHFPHI